jgi:hypothetical protein
MNNELNLDNKTINQLKIKILEIVKKEGGIKSFDEMWQDIEINKKIYDVNIFNTEWHGSTKKALIGADIYKTYTDKQGYLHTDTSKLTHLSNITHPNKVILTGNMVEIDISKERKQ